MAKPTMTNNFSPKTKGKGKAKKKRNKKDDTKPYRGQGRQKKLKLLRDNSQQLFNLILNLLPFRFELEGNIKQIPQTPL